MIVEAYQRLADEGLVSARPGAGTRVLRIFRQAPGFGPRRRGPRRCGPSHGGAARIPRPATALASAGGDRPVPRRARPVRVPARRLAARRSVLEQASVADLGYGDPRGSRWLRTELAGWLARTRGLRADLDDIIIVTGVAQALALLARVLRDLGEIGSKTLARAGPATNWPTGACARYRSRWTSTGSRSMP